MDMAANLTIGIWVEVVATVGVGAVEFTGEVGVGVIVMGWVITVTLYFLLASMVLLFLSLVLGLGAFSGHGVVILRRCTGAWLWLGLGLGPAFGTKLTLEF